MSRRKADPLETALNAFHSLDPAQQAVFQQTVRLVKQYGMPQAIPGIGPTTGLQPRRGRPPKQRNGRPPDLVDAERAYRDSEAHGRDAVNAATGEGL